MRETRPYPRSRRGVLSWRQLAVFSIGLGYFSGCTQAPATSPKGAVERYVQAVDEERYQDAYRLLSSESRANLSFEAFVQLMKENPKEVKALMEALSQESNPPMVTARITTKSGEILELSYEEGAWRINESAVVLYDQSSPREAMNSFVRAYDHERYDVLLRFVPDSQKDGLTAAILRRSWQGEQELEMEQVVEALRQDLKTGKLEVLGNTATMSYGAGALVQLVSEHGTWKIEDFQ